MSSNNICVDCKAIFDVAEIGLSNLCPNCLKNQPPEGWEDITERKPLNKCTSKDLDGYFFSKKHGDIKYQSVFSETAEGFWCNLDAFEGFHRKNDDLFPPENYLKIRKK